MSKQYKEGWESFHRYKGAYRNPYRINSSEYNEFERGWSQALKRCDDAKLRKYQQEKRIRTRPT